MANGQIAASTTIGGVTGLAAGPIGGAVGAIAGFVAADAGQIFGSHKKKPAPVTTPLPWYKTPADLEIVGVAFAVVVLVILLRKKK